jgi:hypothetical protein
MENTQHRTGDLNTKLCVQYGCGICAPDGWLNFDISPTLRLQKIPFLGRILTAKLIQFPANVRYGDIVRGLPLAKQSCEMVYCSHVLEHLALEDFRAALNHTWDYLRPGGTFRFVLPDLEQLAHAYFKSNAEQPSVWFMESTILGTKKRPRGLLRWVRHSLGNSRHLWMWDFKSIQVELKKAGFVDIRRAYLGDGNNPMLADVENPILWGENNLGVQCKVP